MDDRKAKSAKADRAERLAAALRENLRRRKSQDRGRAERQAEQQAADRPPAGPQGSRPA